MPLEIAINRTREQVHTALLQFVAQRGYALTRPGRADGLRIEAPSRPAGDLLHGLPALSSGEAASRIARAREKKMTHDAGPMCVEMRLLWRRGKTILAVESAEEPWQIRLVEDLRTALTAAPSPAGAASSACPQCGAPVTNALAKFCGRCGMKIAGGE